MKLKMMIQQLYIMYVSISLSYFLFVKQKYSCLNIQFFGYFTVIHTTLKFSFCITASTQFISLTRR